MTVKRILSVFWGLMFFVLLLAGAQMGRAQGPVLVQLSPAEVGVAETAVVEGRITCPANGCGGFKIAISFDRSLVRVESAQVGPFLGAQVFEAENTVDNAAGQVRLVAAAMAPPPGASDVLFVLHVGGLIPGEAIFSMDQLEITDLSGNPINAQGQGTTVKVFETGKIPFFSPPDNRWEVAFTSERDGNPEIYVVNADGSNPRRLTDNPALDGSPAWSPGGGQIAFFSTRDGNAEIYVMNADGSNQHRLTDNPAPDSYPAWSPDGTRIAFVSERDGNSEVYVMNADGSDPRRLTDEAAVDAYPAWSPNGREIAFVSAREGAAEVFMMDADGSNVRRVTSLFGANGWYPAWAPGGTLMTFTSERGGEADIYRMTPAGDNVVRLTEKSGWLTTTDWSPDGQWIAFSAGLTGYSDLYVMDAEGRYWFRITEEENEDYDPDWRPVRAQAPCLVRTDREDVRVHVGPGRNRGVFSFLPPNEDFLVQGQALDGEGKVWWKLDKDQIPGGEMANTLWVAEEDVDEIGDCPGVPPADVPPLVPGTPPPPQRTPGWGPCGSCDTCGHPASECVTAPDGQCVWDPRTCGQPDDGCYFLSTSAVGPGTVAVRTPPNCENGYLPGTPVTIVGIPDQGGYTTAPPRFLYWGGTCPGASGTDRITTLTMDFSCSAIGHFEGPQG